MLRNYCQSTKNIFYTKPSAQRLFTVVVFFCYIFSGK